MTLLETQKEILTYLGMSEKYIALWEQLPARERLLLLKDRMRYFVNWISDLGGFDEYCSTIFEIDWKDFKKLSLSAKFALCQVYKNHVLDKD